MRADNSAHLAIAAKRRHEFTRAKTILALHELDREGATVTFESVARHAGVSRSWLYTQPDITDEIRRLRALADCAPTRAIASRQRASDPSLRQRLDLATTRNRELADENQRLRRQLAHALGDLRAAGLSMATPAQDPSHFANDHAATTPPPDPHRTPSRTPSSTKNTRSQR